MSKEASEFLKKNPEQVKDIITEKSLILIKPDAVVRQLIGEVISRFERKGLKIVAMKMVHPTKSQVAEHYHVTEEWIESNGTRTYQGYIDRGITPPVEPREFALNTQRKLMKFLGAGPVVALVIQGAHVIEIARRMRGPTNPLVAEQGSILADYSLDSYQLADAGEWAIMNIIHCSDSRESAGREIKIWFDKSEILHYETMIERYVYDDAWFMEPKAD